MRELKVYFLKKAWKKTKIEIDNSSLQINEKMNEKFSHNNLVTGSTYCAPSTSSVYTSKREGFSSSITCESRSSCLARWRSLEWPRKNYKRRNNNTQTLYEWCIYTQYTKMNEIKTYEITMNPIYYKVLIIDLIVLHLKMMKIK